jgi:hypothetical protein
MVGHAAYIENVQNLYVLSGSAEGNRALDRHMHRWQNKEVGCKDVESI